MFTDKELNKIIKKGLKEASLEAKNKGIKLKIIPKKDGEYHLIAKDNSKKDKN